jgi:hypothetical protein
VNINRYEKTICNAAWPVLMGLLIWLWVDSAQARWMPEFEVETTEVDCG